MAVAVLDVMHFINISIVTFNDGRGWQDYRFSPLASGFGADVSIMVTSFVALACLCLSLMSACQHLDIKLISQHARQLCLVFDQTLYTAP